MTSTNAMAWGVGRVDTVCCSRCPDPAAAVERTVAEMVKLPQPSDDSLRFAIHASRTRTLICGTRQ